MICYFYVNTRYFVPRFYHKYGIFRISTHLLYLNLKLQNIVHIFMSNPVLVFINSIFRHERLQMTAFCPITNVSKSRLVIPSYHGTLRSVFSLSAFFSIYPVIFHSFHSVFYLLRNFSSILTFPIFQWFYPSIR